MQEESTSVEVSDGESIDIVARLTEEILALKEQAIDLRRRLGRLERQAGRGVPHLSERSQD
jgi:hypothetical protein